MAAHLNVAAQATLPVRRCPRIVAWHLVSLEPEIDVTIQDHNDHHWSEIDEKNEDAIWDAKGTPPILPTFQTSLAGRLTLAWCCDHMGMAHHQLSGTNQQSPEPN